MTFDDYKKHFEVFSKIDTPEKLAICETQYKQHLLALEDEKYFESVVEISNGETISLYNDNLRLTLGLAQLIETQVSFLTIPSLEPESLLIIDDCQDKFVLRHTVLASNHWQAFYADNRITVVDKITSTTELSQEMGRKIFNLFYKVISDARPAKSGRFVLDGVQYFLSCVGQGYDSV